MLVLSRKVNEVICIGGRLIEIIVVDIVGDRVRLGITAPKDIDINRKEVQDSKERLEAMVSE